MTGLFKNIKVNKHKENLRKDSVLKGMKLTTMKIKHKILISYWIRENDNIKFIVGQVDQSLNHLMSNFLQHVKEASF